MSDDEYLGNALWPVLVETVHSMVMYPHHKAYTRRIIIKERPQISPRELTIALRIPLGEAMVILHELDKEVKGIPEKI